MLKYILLGLMMVLLAGAAIVRVRPITPDPWHVVPSSVASKGESGRFTVTSGGDVEPVLVDGLPLPAVAVKLQERIAATPRTVLLAGALEDGFATYVTRSKLWGFPDVTNIKLVEREDGTQVEMAARLVYGQADFGVNEARVRDWLSAVAK